MKPDQAALEVGQLAWDMARGYAAHIAAIRMAPRLDPQAFVRLIAKYPTDFVLRKDGTKWSFDMQDAIGSATWDKPIATELPRVWPGVHCSRLVMRWRSTITSTTHLNWNSFTISATALLTVTVLTFATA